MGLYSAVLPKTLHEFEVDVGGGLAVLYQLDFYQRWFVHIFLKAGWHYHVGLFQAVVGKASERWLVSHFEVCH
jgi:hypothetical protein